MTIATTTAKSRYAGDGVTAEFPTGFKFFDNTQVRVILRDATGQESQLTEGSHYDLAGAGAEAGGTVSLHTSPQDYRPQEGEVLVILLAIAPRRSAMRSTAVEGKAPPSGSDTSWRDAMASRITSTSPICGR